MIYLNAGNIWDNDYLDEVIRLNEQYRDTIQVRALFGSIAGLTPTARAVDRLPYRDWNFIDRYVDKAQKNSINIRYTLNQACIGPIQDFRTDWDSKLMADIVELHSIGIHEWTVTSPLIVELLRSMFLDDLIEVSTIAEVATVEDVCRWADLGADAVNISTNINRDFPAIRAMSNTGMLVEILANEACLIRCPWRRECYNLSSHNSQRSEELFGFYPFRRCNEVRLAHPEEWVMSCMVLPQWMKAYHNLAGVQWFKIAYRTHPIEVALPILKAYMSQDFKGNLCELWPTIAHLGSTPEPKEVTYISCEKLDKTKLLEYFVMFGHLCRQRECGVDCFRCNKAYNDAKE